MTVNSKAMLIKLKKQVTLLKRKEKATRKKLRLAMMKAKKMGKTFQRKLDKKAKETQGKVAAAQAAVYVKLAKTISKKAKTVKVKKKIAKKKSIGRKKK